VIKKEERTKVFTLLAVVALVFGFGVFRIISVTSPSGPTAAVQDTPVAEVTDPAATDEKPQADSPIDVSALTPPGSTDPFRKLTPIVVAAPAVRVAARPLGSSLAPLEGSVSPLPVAGSTPEMTPDETIHAQGVMPGKEAIAVLTVGSQTFVVRKGERFGSGFLLADVGKSSVRVQRGSQTLNLEVGR
jgi:hypothetical protein